MLHVHVNSTINDAGIWRYLHILGMGSIKVINEITITLHISSINTEYVIYMYMYIVDYIFLLISIIYFKNQLKYQFWNIIKFT